MGKEMQVNPQVWKEKDTEHSQTALMTTTLSTQLGIFSILKYCALLPAASPLLSLLLGCGFSVLWL